MADGAALAWHARGLVGLLDLAAHGFQLLFAATWLHHRGVAATAPPPGWSRVLDAGLMTRWNQHHDPVGVRPSNLWAHPRFTVLARHDGDDLTGGAILHEAETVVELSNMWSSGDVTVEPLALLDIAAETHPGRGVVGYSWGADLGTMLGAGFEPLGPRHVWIR